MKNLFSALLCAWLLMGAALADAQLVQGTQTGKLVMGACSPLTREEVIYKTEGLTGVCGGAQYLYYILPFLAAGVDVKYMAFSKNSYDLDDDGWGSVTVEDTPSAATYMAVLRDDLLPEKKFRPYGLLGIGVNNFSRRLVWIAPGYYREEIFRKSTGVAFALAAGVDHDFTENVLAGFELRWNYLGTSEDKVGGFHFTFMSMLLNVGWKFGQK
ncbi:MAG: outer membrane beta-barrel protein [Elusimicrobia bacterium]|nr:outer membrane beta-barrel protein [Elusimicrobiota bacterium]